MKYQVEFRVVVDVDIHNEDIIKRVLENHDDEGRPSTDGNGWRDVFYDLDEAGAVAMLADNVGMRGRNIASLDGWADCSWKDIDTSEDVRAEGVYKNGEYIGEGW